MATRKQSVDTISEAAEVNPVTTEASLQHVGDDYIPRVGRGQRSPHYHDRPLAAVLVALAAPTPIRAGVAVETFWALRDSSQFGPAGETFGEWLMAKIRWAATHEGQQTLALDNADPDARLSGWFCLSPPSVNISTTRRGGYLEVGRTFLPEVRNHENMRRRNVETATRLDLTSLLKVAGALLADTLAREPSASLLPPASSPARGDDRGRSLPKTTKAAEPASSNGLLSYVPATRAYPALAPAVALQAQSATKEGSKQSASRPMASESRVRQPRTSRSAHHGSHWTDTASP